MSRRKLARNLKTTRMLGELSLAAPLVVAHRLSRMAFAGPSWSPRDRHEFTGMVQEKQMAFFQSWMAMSLEAARIQQQMWLGFAKPFMWPGARAWPGAGSLPQWRPDHLLRIASAGLVPVHRKALANSRRFTRSSFP